VASKATAPTAHQQREGEVFKVWVPEVNTGLRYDVYYNFGVALAELLHDIKTQYSLNDKQLPLDIQDSFRLGALHPFKDMKIQDHQEGSAQSLLILTEHENNVVQHIEEAAFENSLLSAKGSPSHLDAEIFKGQLNLIKQKFNEWVPTENTFKITDEKQLQEVFSRVISSLGLTVDPQIIESIRSAFFKAS
jgi:hypothetical protein